MSIFEKTSPLKYAYQSTTQSISIAEDLIQGNIEPNVIDETDTPAVIRGLQALRHKAMVSDQIDRQKRCEYLISELTLKKQSRSSSSLSNRKKTRRSASRQGSVKGDLFLSCSSLPPDDSSYTNFELTEEELQQMNVIIDNLLKGDEIESIDHEAIGQLKYALKERRKLYMNDGNYLLVKKIEEQLLNLARINQDYENTETIKSIKNIKQKNKGNLIIEAQNKLKDIERKIEKLRLSLEDELNKIDESKDYAKTKIFKEIEDDTKQLEVETNEVDLAFSIKPSNDLLQMRSLETKYVKVSRYEAAVELRKMADELETQERKAYDQNARAAINKKEQKKRLMHEQKSQKCEDYYRNIREKTIKKYNEWIKTSEREADAVRERINKLQASQLQDENHSTTFTYDNSRNISSSNANYNDNQQFNDNNNEEEEESVNNNANELDIGNENEVSPGSFAEQEFKEHERNIYTPFNSKLPDSSTSPYVGLTEMSEMDQKGKTSPISPKNQNDFQPNDDQENISEIKINANELVQADQEAENDDMQNDAKSENNQAKPQSKNKRIKKVVKKVVKKVPKKSA